MPFGLGQSKPQQTLGLLRLTRLLWASPNTLLGLLLVALWMLFGARARWVDGALEAAPSRPMRPGGLRMRLPFAAVTLGHVVVAVDPRELEQHRAHERVHVRQYERWGPAFLPAYVASSAWQWLEGRHPYWDNRFELEARRLAP
jgi:hypothetical protein